MGERTLTEFGRMVRHHRDANQLLLKEMADQLDVSSAWLSNVEAGRKQIPSSLIDSIVAMFKLDVEEAQELREAAKKSQPAYRINNINSDRRDVAEVLARRFNDLSQEQVSRIRDILDRRSA